MILDIFIADSLRPVMPLVPLASLAVRIGLPQKGFHLRGQLIVCGLDKNGFVRKDDHGYDDLSLVCFLHKVMGVVVFVNVDPRVLHSMLVKETSCSTSVT